MSEPILTPGLTRANFWDEMERKYPNAMRKFRAWLDWYKAQVNWEELCSGGSEYQNANGKNFRAPKFHELPYAMQMGVWIEYMRMRGGCVWPIENMFDYDLRRDIEGTFHEILEQEAIDEAELEKL